MATRGAKPKPPRLRLVDGTHNTTRHGDKADIPEPCERAPLKKPSYLKGKAARIWAETEPSLWWLDEVDGHKLAMWCCLQAEFEKSPEMMVAARIGQLRALGSELGMDPASRTRLGGNGKKQKDGKDRYFD